MNKTSTRVIEYTRLWESVEASSRKLAEMWQKFSPEEREQALRMTRAMSTDALPPLEMYDSDEVTDVDIMIAIPDRSVV